MEAKMKKDWSMVQFRQDGDLRKPRVAKCTSDQEVLDLLSSVRWEHIKMGLMEAGVRKSDSLLPAIAYLAKHGWNDHLKAQITTTDAQFKDMGERLLLERMEERGEVSRSTVTLMVPANIMADIRGSADPMKSARMWGERSYMYAEAQRGVVRKRAMEALGGMGTKAALMELAKLLECAVLNANIRADSILSRAARQNPKEVIPVLKELVKELEKSGNWKASSELFWICERIEGRG